MSTTDSDLNVQRSTFSVQRSSLVASDAPWPGLAPFTEEQSGLFFGRDEEIRALARLMERKALTILFGQSGLGKSSLLQAGVFPRLRAASFLPIYIRLDHGDGAPSPTEQVKAMVAAGAERAGSWTKPGSAKPGETLWEFFHHRDDRLLDGNGRTIVPVLVFDQFEELFTLGAAAGAQRDRAVAFMSELAELVENRPSEQLVARLEQSADEMDAFDFSRTDYRVCISLREDYLPHLEGLKTIMPALMENRMRLTRMTGTQALDAVLKPGAGLVTEEVARAIVEFVSGARGGSAERLAELDVEPPLLSVICRELNERRRALGQAQITADLVTGNRREILHDFYERSVADLPEPMRRFVEDKLLTKSGFRDNLALETALEEPGVTKPLIDTLVSRRLLRIEDRIGTQRVELTHDVLADVVRASRDDRQQRLALEQAQERESSALAAAARRTRRQRWIIAGLATAVVALLVGAFFGLRAQLRAKQQASHNDFILGSQLLDEGKLADGLARLVRAARTDPTNDVIASRLLSTLATQNFAFSVGAPLPLPSPAVGALYSPDGHWLGYQGADGILRLIDTKTWSVARTLSLPQPLARGFSISLDDAWSRLAAKLEDGQMLVCDLTGKILRAGIHPPEGGNGVVLFGLSPDGRWLGATDDATLWIWDAASGVLRATLPHNGIFQFSPDSTSVATFLREGLQTRIYSVPDGKPLGTPIVYTQPGANGRFFSRDGRRVFVKHAAGVQAYDIASGKPSGSIVRNLSGGGYDCVLSPDGTRLAFFADKAVIVDLATGQMIFPPFPHGGRIRNAGFSRDGTTLFTNAADGLFRLWDLRTGKLLGAPMHRQDRFTPAALSPDGRDVAVFSAAGPVQRVQFRAQTATSLALPRTPDVRVVNFLPGAAARLLWVTSHTSKVIDVATGRVVSESPLPAPVTFRSTFGSTADPGDAYFGRTGPHTDVQAAIVEGDHLGRAVTLEDSKEVVIGNNLVPGHRFAANAWLNSLTFWELGSGRKLNTIAVHGGAAIAASFPFFASQGYGAIPAFSRDESRIAYQTVDGAVHVCEVPNGREVFALRLTGREQLHGCRFGPGGQLLTGASDGTLRIWDTKGALLRETPGSGAGTVQLDVSQDGRRVSGIAEDNSVSIWELETGRHLSTIPFGFLSKANFSADGERLLAAWHNGVRVWDVRTGQPVTDELTQDDFGVGLLTRDGRFVSTSTLPSAPDGMLRLWAVPPRVPNRATPEWLLDLATLCAGQRLTDNGELEPAGDDFTRLAELRRTIDTLPADDALAEWGRWIVSDDPNRPIAPGFKITPAEADKLREDYLKAGASTAAR